MAAEAKHSETIARQRKRKVIREVPEAQDSYGASGEIARAKSGVNSPNVHMGLVTSNVDATWGCVDEPAERSGEKEIVPLGVAF